MSGPWYRPDFSLKHAVAFFVSTNPGMTGEQLHQQLADLGIHVSCHTVCCIRTEVRQTIKEIQKLQEAEPKPTSSSGSGLSRREAEPTSDGPEPVGGGRRADQRRNRACLSLHSSAASRLNANLEVYPKSKRQYSGTGLQELPH